MPGAIAAGKTERGIQFGHSRTLFHWGEMTSPNSSSAKLPQFVHDLLAAPPRRGEGLNNWFYRVARVLHPYRTPAEIEQLLAAATLGEPVKPGEIERAVARSADAAWQPGSPGSAPGAAGHATPPAWPEVDAEARAAVLASGLGVADLWDLSPIRFEESEPQTEPIIDALFPGNPLLCVGRSNHEFATRTRDKWRGRLAEMQLIVPSPMTARTGLTQEGHESEHSLENTGPRRFLIIEQDSGTPDEQAAVLLHLAQLAPLALAVHSGSKSIHGWFLADGEPEDNLRAFMRSAVTLGADRATWTRSQFVRMPDGLRDNGKRQTVYFFDPSLVRDGAGEVPGS